MTTQLSRHDIIRGLTMLGKLAKREGITIELCIVCGAVQCLDLRTREKTRDVDAMFLSPPDRQNIRWMVEQVARQEGLPAAWLNEAPRIFLVNRDSIEREAIILQRPGITVLFIFKPSKERLWGLISP